MTETLEGMSPGNEGKKERTPAHVERDGVRDLPHARAVQFGCAEALASESGSPKRSGSGA